MSTTPLLEPPVPQIEDEPAAPAATAGPAPSPPEPAFEPGLAGSTIGQLLAESFEDEALEKRRMRRVLAIAIAAHVVFFLITFPSWSPRQPDYVRPAGKIYVVQSARFEKPAPPPPSGAAKPVKSLTKKIPIPDPTPDEPEPILDEDAIDVPETPLAKFDEVFFGIPGDDVGGPDSRGQGEKDFTGDAMQLGSGSGILPPVAISKPEPRYTEEARRARVQGVVILSCVIDEKGVPRNLEVVKGLSLGLTESALETAKNSWRFKPATKNGQPVPVHFLITINFSLQ